MKRHLKSTLLAAALAASVLAAPLAQGQASAPVAVAEGGTLWFVELSGAPVADGNSLSAVRSEKAAFRRAAAAAGIRYTERRSFDTLFNGFSIEVQPGDRAKVMALSGVKAMYPVAQVEAPKAELSPGLAPDLANALAMTGANIAQSTLGLSGAGIKVAVMDTGIDIDHPDFGGNGSPGATTFPTARITHGYDLVGDAFNADPASPLYNPNPTPDLNPDDCGGHGTHVAGIVGANGTIKGVAPGVTFGAYRVFGCNGSTTADIMVSAMEMALADGMHVLNMSIGSAFQWPQYPTAQAADRLVNKGMVVVTSIGNSGANGLYSASAPGLGQKVIGTASFDNSASTQLTFTVVPGGESIGYNRATASPPSPVTGSLPMARTGTTTTTNDACSALPAGSLAGQAVLIRRGTCTFNVKSINAQNAGAAAVVIYNNAAGPAQSITVAGPPNVTIPVVTITNVDGALLDGKIAAGPTVLSWTSQMVSVPVATGGLISSFSSYGLAPDLSLKPDIGAPGGLIFSTVPLEQGAFGNNSGTSMASPHVAGAVALLLEARPKTSAQAVRGILQNSADPKNWWGNPGLGFLDNVHRQGAGMLDIDDAILATTSIEPSKIAAGEGQAGPFVQLLTIKNSGSSAVTYNLSSVNALSTGANSFTPAFSTSDAGVTFSAPAVVVAANSSSTVTATVTPATAPAGGQYGGYIVLTDAADAAKVLRVPFAGYIGDYQARQVLVPTANGFPWLAKTTNGTTFSNNAAGAPYSMVGFDIPHFAIHLDHQARRLRIEASDAVSGKAWHRVSDDEYLPRNSTATGIFAFAWDGTTFSGKGKNGAQQYTVPNGSYRVTVNVLKALGDESNPAHWETWTSPAITIARP